MNEFFTGQPPDPQYDGEAIYVLFLNMMRNRSESRTMIGWARSKEAICAYLESEKAPEPYSTDFPSGFHDGMQKFRHYFRAGGPLQWFNPEGEIVEGKARLGWATIHQEVV